MNLKICLNTAVISLASTGIGKELDNINAEQRGDLIITARNKSKIEDLILNLLKSIKSDGYS
jgi:short-subunit dehydrogenase